jgi:hypothetical protein
MAPVVRGGGEAVYEKNVLSVGGLGWDMDVRVGKCPCGGVG